MVNARRIDVHDVMNTAVKGHRHRLCQKRGRLTKLNNNQKHVHRVNLSRHQVRRYY